MSELVLAPANFIPQYALTYGATGTIATEVDVAHPLPAVAPALSYTQTSIVLTAAQAAGTDPLVAANPARRALQFAGSVDFKVALAAGQSAGMPIYGSARDELAGALCPVEAIYLVAGSGAVAGGTIVIWEA